MELAKARERKAKEDAKLQRVNGVDAGDLERKETADIDEKEASAASFARNVNPATENVNPATEKEVTKGAVRCKMSENAHRRPSAKLTVWLVG